MKLQLYYPLNHWNETQGFGANNACINPETKEVKGKVGATCPTGTVSVYEYYGMKGHTGIDVPAPSGTPVYAAHDGVVEEVNTELERGLGVGIVTEGKYEMEGGMYHAKTRYWHLKSINVELKQKVKAGDLIGTVDNTGISSGDHLHFELKPTNYKNGYLLYNVFQDNGYFGGIDPTPYWAGVHASQLHTFILRLKLKILQLMLAILKLKGR